MARGILSEYGPDAKKSQVSRASSGGVTQARDVNKYRKPQGPTSIGNRRVGLGGDNLGVCGTQGHHAGPGSESGGPGLGGSRREKGSQR
jgi:hypothetical protein